MKVHNTLENDFQEVIYQRCLAIELEKPSIRCAREVEEVEQEINYDNKHAGTRRADFVIPDQLIVELKAFKAVEDVHLTHAKTTLQHTISLKVY